MFQDLRQVLVRMNVFDGEAFYFFFGIPQHLANHSIAHSELPGFYVNHKYPIARIIEDGPESRFGLLQSLLCLLEFCNINGKIYYSYYIAMFVYIRYFIRLNPPPARIDIKRFNNAIF